MTAQSTRKRLRQQGDRASDCIDRAQEHLLKLDAYANQKSAYINDNLSQVVAVLDMAKTVLSKFNEGL